MSEISRIPWKGSRETLTLTWDELAQLLATAQEDGYRAALTDAGVDDMDRNRLVTNYWAIYATRADLIAAGMRKRFAQQQP